MYIQIFASLVLASLTGAAAVHKPKVLSLPFTKVISTSDPSEIAREKRAVTENLDNGYVNYIARIQVGTPPREVQVSIDTGSSDLWIDEEGFNPSDSFTWATNNQPFYIGYMDGTQAKGVLGNDTVTVGGATLKPATFASVKGKPLDQSGIFGIGYSTLDKGQYPNIPALLKEQGFIDSISYSLWLNDFNTDNEGSVLFGGVDHARYDGTLVKVPIIIPPRVNHAPLSYHSRLTTILSGISLKNSKGEKAPVISGASLPTLLDSGATLSHLPPDFIDAIANSIPNLYSKNAGNDVKNYYSNDAPEGTIVFDFLGAEVEILLANFFFKRKGGYYQLGAQYSGPRDIDFDQSVHFSLGDTFLTNAYVAYDLDNNEIGLANAKIGNIEETDVEGIGSDGIPGTAAPSYSSTSWGKDYTTHVATVLK